MIFSILILVSSVLLSQTVVPLNTPFDDIPDNGYVKDTQNQLNPFQGTWIYQEGSKKVTIKLEKLVYHLDSGRKKYYVDIINGRYKAENGSTIVYDDLNEPMLTGDISGNDLWQGYYHLSYWDEKECRLLYDVKIKLDPTNSNKLIWEMSLNDHLTAFETDCPRLDDPDWGSVVTLPENMVLTRQ